MDSSNDLEVSRQIISNIIVLSPLLTQSGIIYFVELEQKVEVVRISYPEKVGIFVHRFYVTVFLRKDAWNQFTTVHIK